MKQRKSKEQYNIEWELAKTRLLRILFKHVGAHKACDMGALYEQVFDKKWNHKINDSRKLRKMITHLRTEGTMICSSSSSVHGGYYIAATDGEAEAYFARANRRYLKSLALEARMRGIPLPELKRRVVLDQSDPIEEGERVEVAHETV